MAGPQSAARTAVERRYFAAPMVKTLKTKE
jgi:hypothetical protein